MTDKEFPICCYCGFPVNSGKAQRVYIKGARVAHANINICIQVMNDEIARLKGIIIARDATINQLQDEIKGLAESLRLAWIANDELKGRQDDNFRSGNHGNSKPGAT